MLWFFFPIFLVLASNCAADLPQGFTCLPGSTWVDNCLKCTCPDRLAPPSCSSIPSCHGPPEEPKQCAPHTSWKWENDVCVCTAQGQRVCTGNKMTQ